MGNLTEYKPSHRMRDLIEDNSMLLMVLSRFGISLGFGEKTVAEICQAQGVDAATFISVANYISFGRVMLERVEPASLTDYLIRAHAYFLDFCLPRIRRKLIEAIDCSGNDRVALLILQFYDSYTDEVRRHMEYENETVFDYVRSLLNGRLSDRFSISVFASGHHSIHAKLQELKDIIIRYLPQRENNLLNAVLFDIINCEEDLTMHCKVEDDIFTPTVMALEEDVRLRSRNNTSVDTKEVVTGSTDTLSNREREIVACVARGMANKEIADALCLSVHTVTTHRRNIAQKLQIHSTAALAIYAVINGLVPIEELKNAQ